MSGSRLISAFGLAVIFAQISAILSANIVPVLVYNGETGKSKQPVDALRIMSKSEFSESVFNIVGGSQAPILTFRMKNLCAEDFSQGKIKLGDTPFVYWPSVDSPLSTLEDLEGYNISTEERPEKIAPSQLIFVPIHTLAEIAEIYHNLHQENPKLVALVTGDSCRYSRSERTRRAATVAPRAEGEVLVAADRILFYSSGGIYLKTSGAEDYILLGAPTSNSSVNNASDSVRLDLTFSPDNTTEITLRLQFTATATKYWYFESVEYESNAAAVTLVTNNSIYFPFNFSYHCAKDSVYYHNVTTFLNFTDIQVQIDPSVSVATGTVAFSDGYDCIGFTSIPILSGLFITAIMALIMIWAMTMIMDIRTMDRFDDPKGKTITIAVSE